MKKVLIELMLFALPFEIFGQTNLAGLFLDENRLSLLSEDKVVSDPMANGQACILKLSSSMESTAWYGPYSPLQAGSYVIQFRLKVSSNEASVPLIYLDVVNKGGANTIIGFTITPIMFRNSNEWQLFSFPVQIPEGFTDWEFRGMSFRSGVCDLYLDYINVIPGDSRGSYTNEFTVSGRGDVGIGVRTPTEKLSVNGNIRAKEIKVENNNWPDYVFHDSYNNYSLDELARYIKNNQHLPGIPTAAEVSRDGVNISKMNGMLLKKIEELTLHLIEQNQRLSEQEKKLKVQVRVCRNLQKEVARQREQLEKLQSNR